MSGAIVFFFSAAVTYLYRERFSVGICQDCTGHLLPSSHTLFDSGDSFCMAVQEMDTLFQMVHLQIWTISHR